MIVQVAAMISMGLLTIFVVMIIFGVLGLLYLAFEKLLGRKSSKVKLAKIAEAQNLEKAGRYEDSAEKYDELRMWDKAGDCRRMAKTNYVVSANVNIGKAGAISMDCPYCGASQPIAAKSNEVTCRFCGKNYVVPKKVLDLL